MCYFFVLASFLIIFFFFFSQRLVGVVLLVLGDDNTSLPIIVCTTQVPARGRADRCVYLSAFCLFFCEHFPGLVLGGWILITSSLVVRKVCPPNSPAVPGTVRNMYSRAARIDFYFPLLRKSKTPQNRPWHHKRCCCSGEVLHVTRERTG